MCGRILVHSYVASVPLSEFPYSMSHHGHESLVDQLMNYFDVEKPAYISLTSTKHSTYSCWIELTLSCILSHIWKYAVLRRTLSSYCLENVNGVTLKVSCYHERPDHSRLSWKTISYFGFQMGRVVLPPKIFMTPLTYQSKTKTTQVIKENIGSPSLHRYSQLSQR